MCSIIILNFNGKHFLFECLTSVFAQSYTDYEVILVDNGSTDGSVEFVREYFPSVLIVTSETNLGFAGGNNLGVRHAKGEIIVLLNNDTTVETGWLYALIQALESPDVAIASSLVLTDGIPQRYYEYNGSINLLAHNIMRVFCSRENIFYANGASLAYKRSLLGEPFDEDYFAYSEDVYLSLRARFMGYDIIHVPDSRVQHYGGATSKILTSALVAYLQERNRLLTILIFFSHPTRIKLIPLFIINFFIKSIASLFGSKYQLRAVIKTYWWIFTHHSLIRKKRRALQHVKNVSDDEVLSWMTARVTNGENSAGKFMNVLAFYYCKIVRLHTIEFQKGNTR